MFENWAGRLKSPGHLGSGQNIFTYEDAWPLERSEAKTEFQLKALNRSFGEIMLPLAHYLKFWPVQQRFPGTVFRL